MNIYVDVLFLENIIINYLVLALTARFVKRDVRALRKFLGALVGAIYVILLIAKPELKFYNSIMAKFLLSLFIIAITFNFKKPINFVKAVAAFYGVSFIFAGSGLAFEYMLNEGDFFDIGLVKIDSKWTVLLMSLIVAVIIGKVLWEIVSFSASRSKLILSVKIIFGEKEVKIKALLDTGNSLIEPFNGLPVIVAEIDALKSVLPEDIFNICKNGNGEMIEKIAETISQSYWMCRFRLIPFTSIGNQSGMLLGFKPDKVLVSEKEGEKIVNDSIIALYNKELSNGQGYKALLSFEFLESIDQ
jgi:stage II sporulation protein GA (sporulation sigma-E factor processing peptidase)